MSDLGPEFQNSILQTLCKLLQVRQLRTTSYRPNSNGKIERIHRSLNSLMAKVVSETQRDWSQHLSSCAFAYNVSKHESTLHSPYFLMHGREALCPLDIVMETPARAFPSDVNDYAEELVQRLQLAFMAVGHHTKMVVDRMKRNYDANVKEKAFSKGQLVLYYYPRRYQGRAPKWSRFYTGPFMVESALNDVNFILKKTPRSKPIIAHIDKLRPYYGEIPTCWKSVMERSVETEPKHSESGEQSDEINHSTSSETPVDHVVE